MHREVVKAKGQEVRPKDFGFALIFGVFRRRAEQLQWVAEIIGTKRALLKEVRETGGSETMNAQITNYSNSARSAGETTDQWTRMTQGG